MGVLDPLVETDGTTTKIGKAHAYSGEGFKGNLASADPKTKL